MKPTLIDGLLRVMYVHQSLSIHQISAETSAPVSTIRFRLKALGVLRSRAAAVRAAGEHGRLGSGLRGKKRPPRTQEWSSNISKARIRHADQHAIGTSVKPSGYVEITRGANKGRGQHVVMMEQAIGRRIRPNEVVHHRDEDRAHNDLSNFELMTRADHSALHAAENAPLRKRNSRGQFE